MLTMITDHHNYDNGYIALVNLALKNVPDLTKFSLVNEFRYVKRDDRETIVAMVKLEGTEMLFNHLSQKYGVELPLQPTHITIYTLQPEVGIGILSHTELERDSVAIQIPELFDAAL